MHEPSIEEMTLPLRQQTREVTHEPRVDFEPLVLRVMPGRAQIKVNQPAAVIGRHSGADIRLAYPEISRRHCRITFENGRWRIVDLNSLNGIWVNGQQMLDVVLYNGDRVRIGGCTLTVERGSQVRGSSPRASDPEIEMLQSIADVLPQAG